MALSRAMAAGTDVPSEGAADEGCGSRPTRTARVRLRQDSGRPTAVPRALGAPRRSFETSADRNSAPWAITQLATAQTVGSSSWVQPLSAMMLVSPLTSVATTAQHGAGIHSSAWRTSHKQTFCGSSVAFASRTASMSASRRSSRGRSVRKRTLIRLAKSGRRDARTVRRAESGLLEIGLTARRGGGALGHECATRSRYVSGKRGQYTTGRRRNPLKRGKMDGLRKVFPTVRTDVPRLSHDHARSDAPPQGLAQVEPWPRGARLHRFL